MYFYDGIPRYTQSMITNMTLTEHFWEFCQKWIVGIINWYWLGPCHKYYRENKTVNRSVTDAQKLPLNIRERDVLYQFHRVVLFDRLLKGYPHTKVMLVREARNDIPPLYRASIWASILDVQVKIHVDWGLVFWFGMIFHHLGHVELWPIYDGTVDKSRGGHIIYRLVVFQSYRKKISLEFITRYCYIPNDFNINQINLGT